MLKILGILFAVILMPYVLLAIYVSISIIEMLIENIIDKIKGY